MAAEHPLGPILDDAAAGRFPPADGAVEVLPPDRGGRRAVVSLTAYAYVLADVDRRDLLALGADGVGGASSPDVLRAVAGPTGTVGSLDALLVARGRGGGRLERRTDLAQHPRVQRALRHRDAVEVFADDVGLVTLGRGLVGRREMSVELLEDAARARGHGRRLIAAGLGHVPVDQWCWAHVAPGNAASLRAFLAAGFVPVGSVVIVEPASAPLRSMR